MQLLELFQDSLLEGGVDQLFDGSHGVDRIAIAKLVGLFVQACFKFDRYFIIHFEDCNLHDWMFYLTDDAQDV